MSRPDAHGGVPGAVLDTNVLVSAVLGSVAGRRRSPPVLALAAVQEGRVRLYHSPRLLEELFDVLQRPRIGLSREAAAAYANEIGALGRGIRLTGELRVLQRDPDDNHVLECAALARADFLVTGNTRHYEELGEGAPGPLVYGPTRIVTPAEFVQSFSEYR